MSLLQPFLDARAAGGRGLLVTGGIGAGKTAAVLALAEDLRQQGLRVGGVASPRVLAQGKTVGYRVRDLATGEERPLCSLEPPGIPFRRFFFSPDGLQFANAALKQAAGRAAVAIVDEVGPLELSGGGFAPGLQAVLCSTAFLVLTVRPSLVEKIRSHSLSTAPVVTLDEPGPTTRSRDDTRRLFDRWGSDYGRLRRGGGPLSGYDASLSQAAAFIFVEPGQRLLDIGIGTGAFAARAAQPGAEVWGVDPSPGMLARCRDEHPGFRPYEGHFLSLSVPEGTFHAVVSSFAFHHLAPPEYEAAFREVLRALVPGGRFVVLDVMFAAEEDREAARSALGDSWDVDEAYPLVADAAGAAKRAGAVDVASHQVGTLHWAVTGTRPRHP